MRAKWTFREKGGNYLYTKLMIYKVSVYQACDIELFIFMIEKLL